MKNQFDINELNKKYLEIKQSRTKRNRREKLRFKIRKIENRRGKKIRK